MNVNDYFVGLSLYSFQMYIEMLIILFHYDF